MIRFFSKIILGSASRTKDDWRFTIRNISIENRVLTVNKDQYLFKKELGSGAFGCVYSARHLPDSKLIFNVKQRDVVR